MFLQRTRERERWRFRVSFHKGAEDEKEGFLDRA